MPYSLTTLPFPFQQRLCQLLKPVEAAELWRATGHLEDVRYLPPIERRYHSVEYTSIQKDHPLKYDCSGALDIHDGLSIAKPKKLYLFGLKHTDFYDEGFAYLNFQNTTYLNLGNCLVTDKFLITLLRKGLKPDVLCIKTERVKRATYPTLSRISTVFKAFPSLQKCNIYHFDYPGWLRDLADYGKTNLKTMSILSNEFDTLFSFEPVELYKFVKAQNADFKLIIYFHGSGKGSVIESKVLPLFQPYFNASRSITGKVVLEIGLYSQLIFDLKQE